MTESRDKLENISFFYIEKTLSNCFHFLVKSIKFVSNVCGVYLMWITAHYISSHLYVKFCVPDTLIGFLISPFMTATPHCQGLRWILYNGASMISNMWIAFGTWICSTIFILNVGGQSATK